MSDLIESFRVQFDALITKIKQDLCREVDAKANGLFGLLQEEWDRQMQTTGDQVVVKNEENNGNAGDDTVSGHVKVEDDSIKSECDSESEWDTDSDTEEDIEVKKEEEYDDDDGEHDADANDNESIDLDDGETDDPIETNQPMFDEEDTVINTVNGNESAVDQADGNGDEDDDDEEQTEDAVAGSDNSALNNSIVSVPNEPILQVASTSGLRRSNRTSTKRRQITPDDVTSSDDEDSGSEDNRAGPKRKKARIEVTPVVHDRPRQEANVDQEDSKNVITISLNCTVTGCTKKFRDKALLIEHLKRQHRIDRYPCHVRGCTMSFTTSQNLGEHRRSAHGSLTRWPCGHCSVQCTSFHNLFTHVYEYHELGRFVCGHAGCDFPASTYRRKVMDHLRQHKPAIHQCTFAGCGIAFKSSADLKKHTRTHTGERPFICDHCQKAFNRKENLTRHVHRKH